MFSVSHLNQESHLVLFKANGKNFLRQEETSVTQILAQRNKEIKTGSQVSVTARGFCFLPQPGVRISYCKEETSDCYWSPVTAQHVPWTHQIAQTQRLLPPPLTHPHTPKKTPGGLGNKVNSALKKKRKTDGLRVWMPHLKEDYLPYTISKKRESCPSQSQNLGWISTQITLHPLLFLPKKPLGCFVTSHRCDSSGGSI